MRYIPILCIFAYLFEPATSIKSIPTAAVAEAGAMALEEENTAKRLLTAMQATIRIWNSQPKAPLPAFIMRELGANSPEMNLAIIQKVLDKNTNPVVSRFVAEMSYPHDPTEKPLLVAKLFGLMRIQDGKCKAKPLDIVSATSFEDMVRLLDIPMA